MRNYDGAPEDGSVWLEAGGGDCSQRVIRGGSWYFLPVYLRSSNRKSNRRLPLQRHRLSSCPGHSLTLCTFTFFLGGVGDKGSSPLLALLFFNSGGALWKRQWNFSKPAVFTAGFGLRSVSVADVNGDGTLDIVIADELFDEVSVLLRQ